jgi:phosphate-selective porin
MFTRKTIFRAAGGSLAAILSLAAQPVRAQGSDAERLQKLEQAVSQLQKRNAELEQEVSGLKKRTSWEPVVGAEGKTKTEVTHDGKTYVEKVVEEKLPIYVQQRGPELKLVLGGFVQFNSESGDPFAYLGNFGQTAIDNRFRLRRARINLTGDYAEQFDFKLEGDFAQSDGTNGGRTAFSGTDIFINWHQFPAAQVKVGQYKAPFGLEQLTPDTSLFTIERSIATGAITPERQIGVQLWGKPLTNLWPEQKDLVTYYAGFFNGNNRNININDNNNFMFVGRLELQPLKDFAGKGSFLKLGGDVLNSRDDAGVNISQSGNLKVNSDGSLSSFTLPEAAQRTAWSVDAWLEIGPFDLIGEYLQETVLPRTVPGATPAFSAFNTDGFYVTGAYYIVPKKLQAVVQWQFLNPGQMGNDGIPSILGGLNYYIHGNDLRLSANYIHTWSDFREANPQFGDDQFDEVLVRLQAMF